MALSPGDRIDRYQVIQFLGSGGMGEVGPTHIFEVTALLRAGRRVDLNGAAYSFDYDVKTGEAPSDYVIQCVGVDAEGVANDAVDSGLVVEARTGNLRGTLRCP